MKTIIQKINNLIHQTDFKENPIRAIYRRIFWRARWTFFQDPWAISLNQGPSIFLSKNMGAPLYYFDGKYESETFSFIEKQLKKGMVFFDVGAHIGFFSLMVAHKLKGDCEIHAFEPNPEACLLLSSSMRLNHLEKIKINQVIVSDENKERIPFYVDTRDPSRSSMMREPDKEAQSLYLSSITLDKYWSDSQKKIDLIKIDTEGAELKVLRGAQQLLTRPPSFSPVIVLEVSISNYRRFGYGREDVFSLLAKYGYSLFLFSANELITIDDIKLLETIGLLNIIAIKH